MKPLILVVDDEPDIRTLVKDILQDEGYDVDVAENGAAARSAVARRTPDLILLDIWMPDVDGISLLKEFTEAGVPAPVVMISGHGTVESAVEATRLGAYDFIEKPLSLGKLLVTVQTALASGRYAKEAGTRRTPAHAPAEPVGRSSVIQRLRDQIRRVAEFDTGIVISGESGAGKETLARYLHACSRRHSAPFIAQTVAVVPGNRMDEVLFGRETGGDLRKGVLEEAHGGILFLNDIADLDAGCQVRLLDLCTTRSFKRVGGSRRLEVDVRLVGATHGNLRDAVAANRFREDLFYRIGEISLHVPALREHVEDIPDLLHYFTDLFVADERLPYRRFSVAAQNWLRNYAWPGNVLELRNLVHRVLILGGAAEISLAEVEQAALEQTTGAAGVGADAYSLPLREARERFEKDYLEYHLKQTGGNVVLVARQAGMERTHLYRKFRALGIDTKQIKEHKE
jgi:DNA-binding NtrC family response regulator